MRRSTASAMPGDVCRPNAAATAGYVASSSVTVDRSTNSTPSGKAACAARAASMASRVLPLPPTPVSVTSRCVSEFDGDCVQLPAATDERGPGLRQAIAPRLRGPQRRELRPQRRRRELVHAFLAVEPAQAVFAEVDPLVRRCERRDRARPDDLLAVRGVAQPRGPDHLGTEVVAVALVRRAGVQSHAHPQRADSRPFGFVQRALCRARRRDRGVGVVEHRHDRVAAVLHDTSAGGGNGFTQQCVVLGERVRHRLRVRFPQRRMALDVGEEKGRGRARRCSDGPRTAHAAEATAGRTRPRLRRSSCARTHPFPMNIQPRDIAIATGMGERDHRASESPRHHVTVFLRRSRRFGQARSGIARPRRHPRPTRSRRCLCRRPRVPPRPAGRSARAAGHNVRPPRRPHPGAALRGGQSRFLLVRKVVICRRSRAEAIALPPSD